MITQARLFSIVCIMAAAACQTHNFERDFFRESRSNRVERARALTLAQQYRVFRYGNDVIHPPMLELADPIAERGAAAVPFLLEQLDGDQEEIATRDALLIFRRMAVSKSYDVKSDEVVMRTLTARVDRMKSGWQATCRDMLDSIRNS